MQRRLDPETGVSKPFENVSCQGHIQNFFQRERTNFLHFFNRSFFGRLNFSKNDLGGCGRKLPRKNFKNLHTLKAILVLFEQFLGKVCHIFGP